MVENTELDSLLKRLMAEHDSLVQQRELIRQQEQALKQQGAELDRKISGLKQTLQGLSLYSTAPNEPPELTETTPSVLDMQKALESMLASRTTTKTLTECCREILMRNGGWMSPLDVRRSLHAAGFDFSEYRSNPLSSIHTTLKRLVTPDGDFESKDDTKHDTTLYRWRRKKNVEPKN